MGRTPKPLNIGGAPSAPQTSVASPAPSYVPPIAPQSTGTSSIAVASAQVPMVLTMAETQQIGSVLEQKIAGVSKDILSNAKTGNLDDLGDLLVQAGKAAKGYDPSNIKPGVFGFFKKAKSLIAEARMRQESAQKVLDAIAANMSQRSAQLVARAEQMDVMIKGLWDQHEALGPEIARIEAAVAYMEANPPAVDPTDGRSVSAAQDHQTIIAMARTRAANLRGARAIAETQAAQCAIMKTNAIGLAGSFNEFQQTTYPALRANFVLWVLNKEAEENAQFNQGQRAMANTAMQKTSELLGRNTDLIHTQLNTATITDETITKQYDAVINSLKTIEQKRIEGKAAYAQSIPLMEAKSREMAAQIAQSGR